MKENQMDKGNLEPNIKHGTSVPGWTPELGTRISSTINEIGSIKAVSDLLEVKAEQVSKWLDGRARMPLHAAATMCHTAGCSLDWLVTGIETGKQAQPVNLDEMQNVIEIVLTELQLMDKRLMPPELARLCTVVYELVLTSRAEGGDRARIARQALKLVGNGT